MKFEPGTQVEMNVHGEWVGPYTVAALDGRTPEHLVLIGPRGNVFEHYNDAPYNTRPYQKPLNVNDLPGGADNPHAGIPAERHKEEE